MNEKFLQLEGNVDDLLYENGFLKMTRLVQDVGNESIDVTVESRKDVVSHNFVGGFEAKEQMSCTIGSSNDIDGEHPKFNELLGKKIRITVEVIGE